MKSYDTLTLLEPREHILTITLDRPEVANAINSQMGHDLLDVWESLSADPSRYRCVILTGAGKRAFCAGGDLKERNGMSDEQWQEQHHLFERQLRSYISCPLPVIAAVNGAAYGGGAEFALAADFAYGSERARFALTEVTFGIMPGSGGTQNLPRAIGERRAMELILTGRTFTAHQAAEWGMLNKVCTGEDLMAEVLETAGCIADNAPIATRQIKHSIKYGMQMDLRSALMFEIEAYNRMVPTRDRLEGVAAFNEKRKPDFKGN
jgi:enoyl-CoA hydratase